MSRLRGVVDRKNQGPIASFPVGGASFLALFRYVVVGPRAGPLNADHPLRCAIAFNSVIQPPIVLKPAVVQDKHGLSSSSRSEQNECVAIKNESMRCGTHWCSLIPSFCGITAYCDLEQGQVRAESVLYRGASSDAERVPKEEEGPPV